MSYQQEISTVGDVCSRAGDTWKDISPEYAARMRLQNRFRTGLDIARYTAAIMRRDMAEYDADTSQYTQSLGCWHGFIGQQKLIAIKKHFGDTNKRYLYLSGWMIAALRSEFGPLPDQSMHEKTSVPGLIEELYTFLRQADARELGGLFRELDAARDAGDEVAAKAIENSIDNFQTHVVPIIADIDAGFGNEEATYLLAKKMIEAGACAIQIENQVSDEKQCGHQAGKVTVPHADFLAKIRAVRYAFLELGVEDGIIVARTDSLGAGLTKQIAVTHEIDDIGDKYNNFLDGDYIESADDIANGDVVVKSEGKLLKVQARLESRPVLLQGRHRRRPRGAGLYHLAAERRGPAVDRDREAARGTDRRHGQPYPRSRAECQARVQQLAVLQLDPELPPAGVRCLERRGQGRLRLRSQPADERSTTTANWPRRPTRGSAPSRRMRRARRASSTT
jgi:isocitrate lyase